MDSLRASESKEAHVLYIIRVLGAWTRVFSPRSENSSRERARLAPEQACEARLFLRETVKKPSPESQFSPVPGGLPLAPPDPLATSAQLHRA